MLFFVFSKLRASRRRRLFFSIKFFLYKWLFCYRFLCKSQFFFVNFVRITNNKFFLYMSLFVLFIRFFVRRNKSILYFFSSYNLTFSYLIRKTFSSTSLIIITTMFSLSLFEMISFLLLNYRFQWTSRVVFDNFFSNLIIYRKWLYRSTNKCWHFSCKFFNDESNKFFSM